ncbi:MAG: hypothetical protein IKK84_05655 [Clostridia bacterium]|nr:hypothetical protein [Clostridia bacterium]
MSKKYTEAPIDILEMSILEIQNAVDLGLIDYETIARIYLERIEEYNDEFKAVISVNENIVEQAKSVMKSTLKTEESPNFLVYQ